MAAEVLIEFVPEISKVEKAFDELSRKGSLTDTSAAAFKQGNDELQKRNTLLKDQIPTLKKVQTATSQMADVIIMSAADFQKGMKTSGKSADDFIKTLGKMKVSAADTSKTISGVLINSQSKFSAVLVDNTKKTEDNKKSTMSLREEKRLLSQEIARLILAGEQESKQFIDLTTRAGEVDDAMRDANDAIKRTGSDTRGLDTVIQLATGITAGFSIAQGSAALFGDENEDLQKTLLKVNAALLILNGLQEIQNLLKSEYIKTMAATIITQRVHNAQIIVENALQSRSVIVRGLATAAQWALNIAMNANPVGLLITGIAALVSLLYIFSKASDDAAEAQGRLAKAQQASFEATKANLPLLNRQIEIQIKDAEHALSQAKARKASSEEQYKLEKKLGDLRLTLAARNKGYWADEIANADGYRMELEGLYAQQSALANATDKDDVKRKEAIDQQVSTIQDKLATAQQAQDEYYDALSAGRELDLAHQKDVSERGLKSQKASIDAQLALVKEGSLQEMKLKIASVHAQRDIDLSNVELTEGERRAVVNNSEKQIRQIKKDYSVQVMEDEKADLEARLAMAKRGSLDELFYKTTLIEAQRNIELENTQLSVNERKAIEAKAAREITELKKAFDRQAAQDAAAVELIKAQVKLATFRNGSDSYLMQQKEVSKQQAAIDALTVQQSEQSETTKAQQILLINSTLARDLDEIGRQIYEQQVARQKATIDALNNLALVRLNIKASDPTLGNSEQFKAQQAVRTEELRQVEQERAAIHQQMLDGQYDSYQDYQNALTDNTAKEEQKRAEIQNAYADRLKTLYQSIASAVMDTIGEAWNSVAAIQKANRQAALDEQLANLETEKDAILDNTNLTEKQKRDIEIRFSAEQRRIRKQAAEKEKTAAVNKAIIDGILAAIKSYANLGWPLGAIAAAASLVATGIYVNELKSTPTGYAKGTKSAAPGLHWVGEEGPELMDFKGGERVYTHKESTVIEKHWNQRIAESIPVQSNDLMSEYYVDGSGALQIDYEKLGESVAKSMAEHMPDPLILNNTIDQDGLHTFIIKGNSRTEYKNKRYSTNL